MTVHFAVMAELKTGEIKVLRYFPTREAAEDHPVRMTHWKRVWVEPVERQNEIYDTASPLPWNILWSGMAAYIVDANGKKLGALWSSPRRRELNAAMILDKFGPSSETQ